MPFDFVEIEARDEEVEFSTVAEGGTLELIVRLEGASVDEARAIARTIVGRLGDLEVRARTELVSAFLHIANGGYLEAGSEPISEESFLGRAVMSRIEGDVDGHLWFFFDDDDMLWGHTMLLETDLEGAAWSSTSMG